MRSSYQKKDYDAVVVGAGPNGLSAAIAIQQAGLSVLLLEAKDTIGGGLRSAELTLPGFLHDICSAIHPLAIASPFFNSLPLSEFGLHFIEPTIAAAHPFDDGTATALYHSIDETARALGEDLKAYTTLLKPLVESWPLIDRDLFGPLHFPKYPFALAAFGIHALRSASGIAKRFNTKQAKGLWAGMAAHSMLPLQQATTSAVAMVLLASGHQKGWPVVRGGSQQIATALADFFLSIGGKIETNIAVDSMGQLPSAKAVLFDVSPRQLLKIAGYRFSSIYQWQLEKYRYGMGVFKVDWALNGPVPFTAEECRKAGTVHLGNTIEEISAGEKMIANGKHPEKPFVLFAQQSLFDPTRAPQGKHTAWAYCHVPNGSQADMTAKIENQVERFAPGFKELILGRHVMNTNDFENYNGNYIGGDINGGIMDLRQLFTRPALRLSPYKTSAKGIYICSAATPPGGGVHGMCGFNAAKKALKDIFDFQMPELDSSTNAI